MINCSSLVCPTDTRCWMLDSDRSQFQVPRFGLWAVRAGGREYYQLDGGVDLSWSSCKKRSIAVSGNHLNATGNHMPCGITQCYLPPGSGDFPALPQPRLVLDLATPWDARLSWPRWWLQFPRQFTRQRRSPDSEINIQAVSWPGDEPSTASRESDVLTTRPPSHQLYYICCY